MDKYKDNYEASYDDTDEFISEVEDHEKNILRVDVKVPDLHIYMGTFDSASKSLKLERIVHDENNGSYISTETISVSDEDIPVVVDTIENGTGLFVRVNDTTVWPVSDNAKISLGNRTNLRFSGEISELPSSRLAIADMYENLIHKKAKRSLKVISIYGKVQSIVSSKYVPSDQIQLFKKVENVLTQEYPDAKISNGYVAHTLTSCLWELGNNGANKNVKILLRVADSSTGDNCINFSPAIKVGRRNTISFDSEYNARHYTVTDDEIEEGLEATLLKARDNTADLIATMNIQLKHPEKYFRNVISELNKLAKRMGTAKIGKHLTEYALEMFEAVSMNQADFTVWDMIELLWDLPAQSKSDSSRLSLEKTVSRILTLKHDKFDVDAA